MVIKPRGDGMSVAPQLPSFSKGPICKGKDFAFDTLSRNTCFSVSVVTLVCSKLILHPIPGNITDRCHIQYQKF